MLQYTSPGAKTKHFVNSDGLLFIFVTLVILVSSSEHSVWSVALFPLSCMNQWTPGLDCPDHASMTEWF